MKIIRNCITSDQRILTISCIVGVGIPATEQMKDPGLDTEAVVPLLLHLWLRSIYLNNYLFIVVTTNLLPMSVMHIHDFIRIFYGYLSVVLENG